MGFLLRERARARVAENIANKYDASANRESISGEIVVFAPVNWLHATTRASCSITLLLLFYSLIKPRMLCCALL